MFEQSVAHLWLGNDLRAEMLTLRNPDGTPQLDEKNIEVRQRKSYGSAGYTHVGVRDGITIRELTADIHSMWPHMSDSEQPSWVASDDPELASLMSKILGVPLADVPADADPAS